MKGIHWGLIVIVIVAYLVGSKYGSFGQSLLGKVGL